MQVFEFLFFRQDVQANWCITTQNQFTGEVLPAIQQDPGLAQALTNDILTLTDVFCMGGTIQVGKRQLLLQVTSPGSTIHDLYAAS